MGEVRAYYCCEYLIPSSITAAESVLSGGEVGKEDGEDYKHGMDIELRQHLDKKSIRSLREWNV
jgi:hypothetical protein